MIKIAFFVFSCFLWKEAFCKAAIGIDFDYFTRISCVNFKRPAFIDFVPDETSSAKIPSSISFLKDDIFFGKQADDVANKPDVYYYSLARLMSEAKDPWNHVVKIGNHSSKDLFSVLTSYFGYLNHPSNDFLAKVYGITGGIQSALISVRIIIYNRCPVISITTRFIS
jgi:hypothetical protein